MRQFTICAVVLALAPLAGADADLQVRWAGSVLTGTHPPLAAAEALGEPDGAYAGFSTVDAEATYADFTDARSYGRDVLAWLLGVTNETLARADVIAFERAGTAGLVFEESTWTFASGADVDVMAIADSPATGNVSNAAYGGFFRFVPPTTGDWPFVLFELETVDPLAADFTVDIRRGPTIQQTPDPDAIGVIPEPATLALLGVGGLFVLRRGRRRGGIAGIAATRRRQAPDRTRS